LFVVFSFSDGSSNSFRRLSSSEIEQNQTPVNVLCETEILFSLRRKFLSRTVLYIQSFVENQSE